MIKTNTGRTEGVLFPDAKPIVADGTPVKLIWARAGFVTSEAQEVFQLGTT
jgi:hypothetical protein